jgi:hypothetical protein
MIRPYFRDWLHPYPVPTNGLLFSCLPWPDRRILPSQRRVTRFYITGRAYVAESRPTGRLTVNQGLSQKDPWRDPFGTQLSVGSYYGRQERVWIWVHPWVSSTKVKLRVWVDTADGRRRKSRVVKVASKEHGGRGEAADKLEAFQAECEEAQKVQAKSVTLSELMTEYTTHVGRVGKAQATVEQYEAIAKSIPDEIGAMRLAELTAHDLDRLYGMLTPRLADNTIRTTHAVLHAALEQAIRWGWVTTNPANGATPPEQIEEEGQAPCAGRRVPTDPCRIGAQARLGVWGRGAGHGDCDGVIDGSAPRRALRHAMGQFELPSWTT